jgi:hypothetical protein
MARSDWQKVTTSLPASARVFVVNFERNSQGTAYHAADAKAAFTAAGITAVVVADPPDFPDRASVQKTTFGRVYGGCIYRFIETGVRQAPCS